MIHHLRRLKLDNTLSELDFISQYTIIETRIQTLGIFPSPLNKCVAQQDEPPQANLRFTQDCPRPYTSFRPAVTAAKEDIIFLIFKQLLNSMAVTACGRFW